MNRYIQYMYSYPHKTAYRPLSGVSLKDYAGRLAGGGHGLYVHIPFCQAKCGYCNLFSVTGQDAEAAGRYLEAVSRQSMQYEELLGTVQAEFSQLAIGGGTPLYLTQQQLEQMFEMITGHFRFSDKREFIIETAPNQTNREKLQILKQQGVTRVSMGIQSFHDAELSALGRQHRAKRAREALDLLKAADFSCVNVDFIYGIPGQTVESLLASLREAVDFGPDEIFVYPLYVKHGAGLERMGVVPDQDQAYRQYEHARYFLQSRGFRQDSMRRFVRTEGKREFQDCGYGTSLSLGCGGRSYLGNLHFCSPYAVTKTECLDRIREFEQTEDFTKITHGIFLSDEEVKRRYVIRHLFIRPGLPLGLYREVFKSHAAEDFPVLKIWMERGFAEKKTQTEGRRQEEFLVLTDKGMGLSDYLGPQLISADIRHAMEEWEECHGQTHRTVPGKSEKL